MYERDLRILLDTLLDGLSGMAQGVYQAQSDDGRIDWREALSLGADASSYAMQMLIAFRALDRVTMKDFIETLAKSDIAFVERT
jgi:hypothetical protein